MNCRQSGQSLFEYGAALALVALVCVGGLAILGNTINRNFNTMISKPRLVSVPMPRGAAGVGDSLDLQNTSDDSGAIKLNGSKISNDLLRQYSEIVLTAGSLGDERVLYGNSTKLVEFADKFKETDPEFYNSIVKLGLTGKQMGKLMTSYQNSPDSLNDMNLQNSSVDYDYAYADVRNSPEYARLSPADQLIVRSLADSSVRLADDVIAAGGAVLNEGAVVDDNSEQIIVCGQAEQCN